MNDRQRLEAIVAVVCRYLPPDGISKEDAMREIIQLVDPLPEQDTRKEWVGLTEDDMHTIRGDAFNKNVDDMNWAVAMARKIDFILRKRNT